MDIIGKLEQFRLEHKLSQVRLAKILGVAFSTVNRWFRNKAKPNRIQTYQIEKLLKVNNKNKGVGKQTSLDDYV